MSIFSCQHLPTKLLMNQHSIMTESFSLPAKLANHPTSELVISLLVMSLGERGWQRKKSRTPRGEISWNQVEIMRNQSRFPSNQARKSAQPSSPTHFYNIWRHFEGNHGEIKQKSGNLVRQNCSLPTPRGKPERVHPQNMEQLHAHVHDRYQNVTVSV